MNRRGLAHRALPLICDPPSGGTLYCSMAWRRSGVRFHRWWLTSGVAGLGREHPTSPRHDEQAAGGKEHDCACDEPVRVRTGRRKYRWFATG